MMAEIEDEDGRSLEDMRSCLRLPRVRGRERTIIENGIIVIKINLSGN